MGVNSSIDTRHGEYYDIYQKSSGYTHNNRLR